MPLTDRLVDFVLETGYDSIPDAVVGHAREMMLNGIGVAIAAHSTPEAVALPGFIARMGGVPECTIIGDPTPTSPLNAALANGVLVHVLDFDEVVLRRANHPTNVMLPTVMALGEFLHAPGRSVIEAFAIGCEVSTKLGAIGDLDEVETTLDHNGWHVEGVAGAVGAAAAAAKLLKLDRDQTTNALGIAVSQASGVQANFGTSTKSLHCGLAAMHGIMAAMLAEQAFTANPHAIEGKGGFLTVFRHDTAIDDDEFISRLGHPWDVVDPGVGLKFYPCGSALHTAIDLAVSIGHDNGLESSGISGVHVSWPGLPKDKLASFTFPRTGLEAKFSLNYVISVALAHGAPTLADFTDEALGDPEVLELMPRITSSTDLVPTRSASRPATVTVTTTDGRTFTEHADHALGHPGNPMSDAQLDAKFFSCASDTYTPEEINSLIADIRHLEAVADSAELFSRLRQPALRDR